jgi:energy-coupling factor transporter ATP-binding protein EcfA2
MLEGIRISNYRSIGEQQTIEPLGKINVFVGPNNSGKSNILRFINKNLIHTMRQDKANGLVSEPHLSRNAPTCAQIGIMASVKDFTNILGSGDRDPVGINTLYQHLFDKRLLWIGEKWPETELLEQATNWLTHNEWHGIWANASNKSGGGLNEHWIPQTLMMLKRLMPAPPIVYEVPITRQADSQSQNGVNKESPIVLDGRGAIRQLAALQSPEPKEYDNDRKRFKQIESFVRTVVADVSAMLSIPHSQDQILVKFKGQSIFPLADLGSGIEQVVLHAIAATSAENSVVTFEEPELHLHPVLQRQLLTYLAKYTSNQYFISTHSAHMIDTLHANVFHVQLVNGQTIIEYAHTDAERHRVCEELGYRPSDIVQSNCVIWVEGPSDRVYLQHWLKQQDSHLQEGVHFAIMFYGGKLLSHLSAAETDDQDDNLENLIQLRMLNRHIAVIIDSDSTKKDQPIRETKQRVVDEVLKHGGVAWVTEGREIENYVHPATLKVAVESVAAGRGTAVSPGKFQTPIPKVKSGSKTSISKIKVAKQVVSNPSDLSRFDLEERLDELCTFIRKANGLGQQVE